MPTEQEEELVVVKTSPWSAVAVSPEEAAAIEEDSIKTKVVTPISQLLRNIFSSFVIGAAIASSVLVPIVAEAVANQVTKHQARQKQKE